MSVITKIAVQKKNKERFNIFVDRGNGEEYGFSVDQDILITFNLRKGLEIDESDFMEILKADEAKKAYNLSLKYLSFRMRSRKEIQTYLRGKEFEELSIDRAIKRLEQNKFVDDLEFAKAFIRSKVASTFVGEERLKLSLKEKGVDSILIEKALHEYSTKEQLEAAKKFSEKQLNSLRNVSKQQMKQKVFTALARKGFPKGIIEEVFSQIKITQEESIEYEAILYHGNKAVKKYSNYNGWDWKQRVTRYLYQRGFPIHLIDKFITERIEESGEEI